MKEDTERGLYRRGKIWWCQLGNGGSIVRMSTGKVSKKEARDFRNARIAESVAGTLNPGANRLTFERLLAILDRKEALEPLRASTRRNRKLAISRLKGHFALAAARRIPDMAERYIVTQRESGLSDSSIKSDLCTLRKALRLADAVQLVTKLGKVIRNLEDSAPRQGFVTEKTLDTLCRRLPDYASPVARFAFWSGWRSQEILGLTWAETDTEEGAIRLPAARSKTHKPRLLRYRASAPLAEIIAHRRDAADAIQRDRRSRGDITPVTHVFTYEDGSPVRSIRRQWENARKAIGKPNLLLHDMRRSFARHMAMHGVSRSAIMRLGGWVSEEVFERYNIATEKDDEDALRKGSGGRGPIASDLARTATGDVDDAE